MKFLHGIYNHLSFNSLLLLILFLMSGCENKIDKIPKSDLLSLPSLTVKDFETVYTDSGKVELRLISPLMEQYNNTDKPYYEFRTGIHVIIYDGKESPTGSVVSRYAKLNQSSNLWELKDSVVVINEQNDKLETEVLYWDQPNDLIYSDRFVKITNVDQIVMGTGFESDSHLKKRKIRKVSATINIPER